MSEHDNLTTLKAENSRLIALLEAHGIEWRKTPESVLSVQAPEPSRFSAQEKVALFRDLFRGRADVYPVRWESKTTGKSGYAPACANEWRAGVCDKPRIKCSDCSNRLLIQLTDAVIYAHLAGEHTVGIYPLLEDDTCHFLAVDFDEAEWQEDACAFAQSCDELGVPVALEISRSGQGAHAWVFFASRVSACDARRLGTAIISHTCSRTRQLKLSSYDRLFPNQDTMPKGGFGNLIALPLQKHLRESGRSVFVDAHLRPYADQWAFLASIQPMAPHDIEPTILRATGAAHPLDVTFIDDEDLATPWKRESVSVRQLMGTMPASLTVTLANLIYFEKGQLPQALANRLIRLAAFQNPEFYKAQTMRMSVWDKPRIIGSAENYPRHIGLPRGCLDAAQDLLRSNGIRCEVNDERYAGEPINVGFIGTLRLDQEAAVSAMLNHDAGVLCAPTAFGKTVTAAAMIARRDVNTLVLVHRTELLKRTKAKFVLGLTATPIRRDGQQPIIFMQCGPIRYKAAKPASALHDLQVVPRSRFESIDLPPDAGIQDVFRYLANDKERTKAIAAEIKIAYDQGRKVLVLTERTDHLDAILAALKGQVPAPFVLHGRMSKKQRASLITDLDALPQDTPRILLATGKLVGEGFDHPPLDTLALAMPVSWKGTLQQYAGRLHREHTTKTDVRILDFVDTGHPALLRMWDKRQRGYRAMGYRIAADVGES
jgi:hypothetical protein